MGVGRALGFDASMPFEELDEEALDAVWNGLKEPVTVIMKYGKRERKFQSRWDGVIKVLRKKYEQTESEWVRGDLQQYMRTKPCPVCEGPALETGVAGCKSRGAERFRIDWLERICCFGVLQETAKETEQAPTRDR